VTCYDTVAGKKVNKGSLMGPGRMGLMYVQGASYCSVTATAVPRPSQKRGTIKIALQIVP